MIGRRAQRVKRACGHRAKVSVPVGPQARHAAVPLTSGARVRTRVATAITCLTILRAALAVIVRRAPVLTPDECRERRGRSGAAP
jgi:hypothetical protein